MSYTDSTCFMLRAKFYFLLLLSIFKIPLGVLQKDETRIADMIDVMLHYDQYVPGNPLIPVILYGDGLSCERVNDASNARINAHTPRDRLEGLIPAIQEWHKRVLLLGV